MPLQQITILQTHLVYLEKSLNILTHMTTFHKENNYEVYDYKDASASRLNLWAKHLYTSLRRFTSSQTTRQNQPNPWSSATMHQNGDSDKSWLHNFVNDENSLYLITQSELDDLIIDLQLHNRNYLHPGHNKWNLLDPNTKVGIYTSGNKNAIFYNRISFVIVRIF